METESSASVRGGDSDAPRPNPNPNPKLRSCAVCRTRKVRCDKQSPCSNCRRANIPCVFPSVGDRPPRWARRMAAAVATEEKEGSGPGPGPGSKEVMERLRSLEDLVKSLSGQLEQAQSQARNSDSPGSDVAAVEGGGGGGGGGGGNGNGNGIQSQFGRLVLKDANANANRSRYVSTGFWSRVNDELDDIKAEIAETEVDSSGEEDDDGTTPSTLELERTPAERHAFLFRHNLSFPGPDLRELHPLPSQVPFLLDVFSENVNYILQVVHMPTIRKIARRPRNGGTAQFTPAYEALMFSIYYAAITSMEDDDVLSNFGSTKGELNLKYRLGLEQALARADFLNVPDLVLIQAFAIFLSLVRRHDSPRFVWMMTGLLIRMAQALGLQRDGTYFKHLTPFEVEMRRRVWYSICGLDVRASEDQGTDFTIPYSSFDTKLPLNINDDDISVDTKETPKEREGITDTTPAIFAMEVSNISRQMMLPGVGIEEQNRLIATIYATLEHRLLRFKPNLENIIYWTVIVITRLMCAKLTLLSHLPTLFSTPSPSPSSPSLGDQASDEKGFRNKLLAAAIEVAEFNHALNAEKAARQWRWIFQTYSHWHAIVYLLLDICRRPWSAMVERAWIALHGPWLIPAQPKSSNPDAPDKDKDLRTWVPLRRLMLKARNHRHAELERLCGDVSAAQQLEIDDRRLPVPETDGTVSSLAVADKFRDIWRALVGLRNDTEGPAQSFVPQQHTPPTTAQITDPSHPFYLPGSSANQIPTTRYTASTSPSQSQSGTISHNYSQPPQPNTDWSNTHENSWFWAPNTDANMFPGGDELMDMDMNLDLDGSDMNWHDWVESARGTEMNTSHL